MKGRIINSRSKRVVLPRVGSIKVGMKVKNANGKEYPRSVDYFVPSGRYASLFTQAYGDKPQVIQIMFIDDDPLKSCNEEYEYRDDEGKLVACGDGETFKVWNAREQRYTEVTTEECPTVMKSVENRYPNRLVKAGKEGWQVTLTLTFIIPMVRGIAGVWQFVSKGTASTIPQIRDTFDAMLEQRGFVKGLLFDLTVKFATTQKPGDKSKFPVVSMIPNQSEENVLKVKEALNLKAIGE